jgi:hypothetical protein
MRLRRCLRNAFTSTGRRTLEVSERASKGQVGRDGTNTKPRCRSFAVERANDVGAMLRLRTEAESVWRSDPYLTRDEFIHEMGWQSKQPWWYWASRRQLIPHQLRYHVWPAMSGCRNTGQPLVRVRDLPEIREALERARAAGRHQLGARWRGKPAHNRGQKTVVRRVKVLRCWACRQLIVRRWWLPLYDPDCGGLAWRPQDVPSLTVWQSNRGAWFVSRWPTDEPSRGDDFDDPVERCRTELLAG